MAMAERFQQALAATLHDPAIAARLAEDGASVVGSTPVDFKRYFIDELQRWKTIVEQTGVKADA